MSARSFGANLLGAIARTDPPQQSVTVVIARTEGNLIGAIVDGGPAEEQETRDLVQQAGWQIVTTCMALTPGTLRMMARRQL